MAGEQDQTAESQEGRKGGKAKLFIILGVSIVMLAAGGYFVTQYFAGEPADGDAALDEPKNDPALFAGLHPPLVVNFKDEAGDTHFMQISLEVMARDQKIIDSVKEHAAVIRNNLILMFGSVNYRDVISREGKEQMLADALLEVQQIIEAETGETGVEAVYFTNLIVQ